MTTTTRNLTFALQVKNCFLHLFHGCLDVLSNQRLDVEHFSFDTVELIEVARLGFLQMLNLALKINNDLVLTQN